jgi:hypothetical protein
VQFRELNPFYASTDTFNAIRPLKVELVTSLLDRISARNINLASDYPTSVVTEIVGGHSPVIVRRRRGQREFRFMLLDRFGEACAFSGPQPPQALEAAHLYSYAKRPEHKTDAGRLLRRDFHALFDANLIAVNPSDWCIEVAPRLRPYETYGALEGSPLLLDKAERPSEALVAEHYEQSRRIFQIN